MFSGRRLLRLPVLKTLPLMTTRASSGFHERIMQPTIFTERDRRKFRHRLLPRKAPHIGIVGAPLVYGQPLTGTDAAPGLLRKSGLVRRLKKRGSHVVDYGDLEFEICPDDKNIDPRCKYASTVGQATKKIAAKVEEVVANGEMCLLLGGDHSVSIGSIFGHMRVRPDMALIWVDAHTDINTPLTTESGNIHGMVLGFLMKEITHLNSAVPGMGWCTPCISSDRVAYIGIRSIDPGEQEILNELGICAYTMADVQRIGVEDVLTRVLERLDPEGKRPLHLSFDVDAIDPVHVPATGTQVKNGLSLRESLKIARTIHKTGRLSLMDVTELNPLLCSTTDANWSADVVLELIIRSFVSKQWRPQSRHPRHHYQGDAECTQKHSND